MIPRGLRRPLGAALFYALPFLALVPLGVTLLWQRGWFGWWMIGAALCSLAGWLLLRSAPKPAAARPAPLTPARSADLDPHWTPAERRAWETAVMPRADAVDPAKLTSTKAVQDEAKATIAAVTEVLRPGQRDAHLAFTVPEGLALVARVAGRMRDTIAQQVPGAHHITVGWLWGLTRWGSTASRAYVVYKWLKAAWRVARPLVNPHECARG